MVTRVRMPRIDASVLEGAVGQWLVAEGRRVEAGAPLVEIITDKATFELEADAAGYLRRQVAERKSVVPVGFVLALMSDEPDELLPDVGDENEEIMRRHVEAMLSGPVAPPEAPAQRATGQAGEESGGRLHATPAARRLARRHAVDLADLRPGVGAVIREADVLRAIERHAGGGKGESDAD